MDDRPAFPLPDGTRIQIDGVEYGNTGPMVYGPAWKRRLRPLVSYLPEALAAPIRTSSADLGAARRTDALTVWLDYNGDPSISSPFCILRDSHGCRFRSVDNVLAKVEPGSPYACLFPFFPRREASLQVETYLDTPHSRRVGSLTVPSPAPTDHLTWIAERLPVIQQSGPLAVTLKDVSTGWCWGEPQRVAREDELDVSRLDFQLTDSMRDWEVAGVKLSDALGGTHQFGLGKWWSLPGKLYVQGSNLCREEPAYRYQLEFSRAGTPGATPDRQYFLGSLDACLHAVRTSAGLPLSDGRKIQVSLDVVGRRQILSAEWKPPEGELGRLWVEGELHQRSWRQTAVTPGHSLGAQTFQLDLPPGLVRTQLHFGRYRSRFVTFTVKPRWVTS